MKKPLINAPRSNPAILRCAIYTRKSTEEGLNMEFNTLDAQRESGEAYIRSQQHEGWTCLPERYDDGGFSGGSMERPALRRLMADIEAGKIDAVVVYKVDRLSRSLLDFARMMQTFEQHKVSFVSVTQQFNTATSMGRLVLNVLLSFAQFEREIISERTRDKIAATRKKGKWSGGLPILGYDVQPGTKKLVINEVEAERVRKIFRFYLEHGSLMPVVHELAERGWAGKHWTTKSGKELGGQPFNRTNLYRLLTNVTYTGKIRYKVDLYPGEHAAIVDDETFRQVQAHLQQNGRCGGGPVRNQFGALLKGLLYCAPCQCAMTPSHSTKGGGVRYRYYVCVNAQKRGWKGCPSKSIPAAQAERFVVDQIRAIGRDPGLIEEVLSQARQHQDKRLRELDGERRGLEKDLGASHTEMRRLTTRLGGDDDRGVTVARLADLQERVGQVEQRLAKIQEQVRAIRAERIGELAARRALASFDPVWEALTPREQTRLIGLLVERVDYDGAKGTMSLTFHPAGIKTLADDMGDIKREMIA